MGDLLPRSRHGPKRYEQEEEIPDLRLDWNHQCNITAWEKARAAASAVTSRHDQASIVNDAVKLFSYHMKLWPSAAQLKNFDQDPDRSLMMFYENRFPYLKDLTDKANDERRRNETNCQLNETNHQINDKVYNYVKNLWEEKHVIEPERGVMVMATTNRRVHGPEHHTTMNY